MERVLITGADGFVASHLVPELAGSRGTEMIGIGLKPGPSARVEGLSYRVLDISDYEALRGLVGEVRPDTVFHLAAQASVAHSWEDPWMTYRVNVMGEVNLLEAIRRQGLEASVHVACSSEEYGRVSAGSVPICEDSPLEPCSHYAVSKVGQELIGLMYNRVFDWRVLVTRGFNQAGPGQSPDFVISSFARQIAAIENGRVEPVLKVGNLEARRDFTDVRDTVRAYRMLMEKGRPGVVYNVCSGNALAISEILEKLLDMTEAEIRVEKDPSRQRPSDLPLLSGDNTLLRKDVGWKPEITFERTLRDTLDYWRGLEASGGVG